MSNEMVSKRRQRNAIIMAADKSLILIVCLLFVSAVESVNINGVEILKQEQDLQQQQLLQPQLQQQQQLSEEDEANIVSESRNLTVYSNETVHLPCMVRNASPQTIVVWNQCEDAACVHLRSPLTINRDNFIEDLRFRVLTDTSSMFVARANDSSSSSHSSVETVTRSAASGDPSYNLVDQLPPISESGLLAWNLEIRKFGKADEACYQCQLNSYRAKTIYYCLKLQTRVTARPRKISVRVHQPIHLKCMTDENVRLSNIKWFRNGHRIVDEVTTSSEIVIEKKVHNDHIYSSLYIRQASIDDTGTYLCKFGHLSEKMHVNVVAVGDEKLVKSAEIRSNQEDESEVVPSISKSISDAMFSSSQRPLMFTNHRIVAILFITLIIRFL